MFAELLARTSFSFLRGASQPNEMVERAKQLGISTLVICDRDGLYGSVRAWASACEVEQRLRVGAEISLETHSSSLSEPPVLAFLAQNHEGYSNLCRLLTLSRESRPKGESKLELEWLQSYSRGLWALVIAPICPGDSSTPSDEVLAAVKDAFGERSRIAVYRHGDGLDRMRVEAAQAWSKNYAIPLVASARPRMAVRGRKALLDVLDCIRLGTTLEEAGTLLEKNAEAILRSEAEMLRLFRDAPQWVFESGEIAAQLEFQLSDLQYKFPCALAADETANQKLRRVTFAGLSERYPQGADAKIIEQVEKELALIAKIDVAAYFLSTCEIVNIARERKILCQGRGSAANSAVCYALGITAVDPAKSALLFERFLSAERHEPPDIDIDFEHERREEVIQAIYERYGRERAAMVCEVISYRGKSAVRDVGKVFGLPLEQVGRLSSILSQWDSACVADSQLRDMGFDPADRRLKQVLEMAVLLEGFPRHLSIHVGGFVLSAEPLTSIAPVEPARMPNRTIIPWDKDDIDLLRFFKVDVLGLGMLTAIRKTFALLHADGVLRQENENFDPLVTITRVPSEQPAVYDMISRGDTVGVFQIESRAQMSMLPRLRPQEFYDLVVEVAIVRPGPIQGGMVHPYLRRRNGEEDAAAPHPCLVPILQRTLGVPLFQEQVMQIAITGAGYSGGEADQLRRDMAAWKRSGKLQRHRERLLKGFEANGISRSFGEALFEQIKGFGEYGFPESHAASFAILVYISSWQKACYPAHFACALLNSQPMGFYSASSIIQDAQAHGVQVRDVDVTRSDWDSTLESADTAAPDPEHKVLRLGLRQIKGLGESASKRLLLAREARPFSSVLDLIKRACLKKNEITALAEAGALAELEPERRQALWQAQAPKPEGLFRAATWVEPDVNLPPQTSHEKLLLDYQRKALSVADHPLRHLRPVLDRKRVFTAKDLRTQSHKSWVSIAGFVTCRQRPATASGVVFLTLEDETGFANIVLWRQVFETYYLAARHASLLLVYGVLERADAPKPGAASTSFIPNPRAKTAEPPPSVIHVIAKKLIRLDVPGKDVQKMSRDFH